MMIMWTVYVQQMREVKKSYKHSVWNSERCRRKYSGKPAMLLLSDWSTLTMELLKWSL